MAWLSNGFQSWSQSGILALATAPSDANFEKALAAKGEDEVYRRGEELSNWHTYVPGTSASFFAGALTARRLRSWVEVHRAASDFGVRIASGGPDTVTTKAGQRLEGERFRVSLTRDLHRTLRDYGLALSSRRKTVDVPPAVGWNSWYDLWGDVRASDLLTPEGQSNADLAKALLAPRVAASPRSTSPLRIVIDDGWEKVWGDWEPNDKFPLGIDGVSRSLAAKGLETGLWIAPLAVSPNSALAKAHPEWLVADASWDQPGQGSLRVLDVTHPEAAEHLATVIRTLTGWGVKFLKLDFLFAGR